MAKVTRADIEARVIAKAVKDPEFKKQLLKDPRAVIAREWNQELPKDMEIKVVEESPKTHYLVIPDMGGLLNAVELGDSMLSAVTGGAAPKSEQCTNKSWCC